MIVIKKFFSAQLFLVPADKNVQVSNTVRGFHMPPVAGATQAVVLNLEAFRAGEGRPAMLRMPVDSAVPTAAYEDASSSAKFARAPGLTGLTRWTGRIPDFEGISSANAVAPATEMRSYEFDSRRYTAEKAALKQSLSEFRSFAGRFEILLIHHAAHMAGFEGTDLEIYAAAQKGELTPANFRPDITSSPYQEELLAGLLVFQEGLKSSHHEIKRDSIVLGAKAIANLSYMADNPDVAGGVQAIIESANEFLRTYDKRSDRAAVADAIHAMAAAVPALASAINSSSFL